MKKVPLIVDSNLDFIASIRKDRLFAVIPPILAENGKVAQNALANTSQPLSAVYTNLNLSDGYGYSVIRFAHRYRPATPIYLLHDEGRQILDAKVVRQLGIQEVLNKPLTYFKLLETLSAPTLTFSPDKVQKSNGESAEDSQKELLDHDSSFVPILAANFVSGSRSYFDLYVRISAGKYLKILKRNDFFSDERIASYLAKTTYFYIRRETQELYLAYCEKMATTAIKSEKISPKSTVALTLNHGQEVVNFLKASNIQTSHIHYGIGFVNNLGRVVAKLLKTKSVFLHEFLSNIENYEHGVGASLIASMLANVLGLMSSDPVRIVGLASLFHDIGLSQLPPELATMDIADMTTEQRTLYETHPTLGANILRTLPNIDPTTIQAVAQHHERKTRHGFPFHLGGGSINKVAEIVGLSNQLVEFLKKSRINPEIDPIKEMQGIVRNEFSYAISEAFWTVFVNKEP